MTRDLDTIEQALSWTALPALARVRAALEAKDEALREIGTAVRALLDAWDSPTIPRHIVHLEILSLRAAARSSETDAQAGQSEQA